MIDLTARKKSGRFGIVFLLGFSLVIHVVILKNVKMKCA